MATIDDFKEKPKVTFESYDKKSSIKTNIMIFGQNWKTSQSYLGELRDFVLYLRELINIDDLLQKINENFQNSKNTIPILYSTYVGEIVNHKVNNVTYQVNRTTEYIIEITNITKPDWIVDKLILQVKDINGTNVYPIISTQNNKIIVNFADGIENNYTLIFI